MYVKAFLSLNLIKSSLVSLDLFLKLFFDLFDLLNVNAFLMRNRIRSVLKREN